MDFVYKPEGAAEKRWPFKPEKLMSPEAEAIERHTGMTFGQWAEAVRGGSMLALHGLLFVLLKRTIPTLKWEQVEFCLDDIDWDTSLEDKVTIVKELRIRAAAGQADEDELEYLEQLEADDAVAAAVGPALSTPDGPADEAPPSAVGKAPGQ